MTMRRRDLLLLPAALAGCATQGPLDIDTSLVAQGQDSRVLFLILHFTVADLRLSKRILTEGNVSSHYLLTDEVPPRIHRLVDESRRAWHAGDSFWKNHAMLNASSVGIEIVNPGPLKLPDGRRVYAPFAPAQIDRLIPLVKDIVARHQIRPDRILGHNEIRPQVKDDPGPMFPWKRLADEGIVPWPDAIAVDALTARYEREPPDAAWFQARLAQHGFRIEATGRLDEQTRKVLTVFQMRYRPTLWDGQPDARTAALLHVLTEPR
ncbi:MAG: N-acetylmuramoyl-L-alanine amidase [Aquabacterium sp.]